MALVSLTPPFWEIPPLLWLWTQLALWSKVSLKAPPKIYHAIGSKKKCSQTAKVFYCKNFSGGCWPTMSRVKSRQHSLQGQKSFTALSPFLLHRGALQGVASFTLICPGLQSDNLNQGPALNWTNASQAAWRDTALALWCFRPWGNSLQVLIKSHQLLQSCDERNVWNSIGS